MMVAQQSTVDKKSAELFLAPEEFPDCDFSSVFNDDDDDGQDRPAFVGSASPEETVPAGLPRIPSNTYTLDDEALLPPPQLRRSATTDDAAPRRPPSGGRRSLEVSADTGGRGPRDATTSTKSGVGSLSKSGIRARSRSGSPSLRGDSAWKASRTDASSRRLRSRSGSPTAPLRRTRTRSMSRSGFRMRTRSNSPTARPKGSPEISQGHEESRSRKDTGAGRAGSRGPTLRGLGSRLRSRSPEATGPTKLNTSHAPAQRGEEPTLRRCNTHDGSVKRSSGNRRHHHHHHHKPISKQKGDASSTDTKNNQKQDTIPTLPVSLPFGDETVQDKQELLDHDHSPTVRGTTRKPVERKRSKKRLMQERQHSNRMILERALSGKGLGLRKDSNGSFGSLEKSSKTTASKNKPSTCLERTLSSHHGSSNGGAKKGSSRSVGAMSLSGKSSHSSKSKPKTKGETLLEKALSNHNPKNTTTSKSVSGVSVSARSTASGSSIPRLPPPRSNSGMSTRQTTLDRFLPQRSKSGLASMSTGSRAGRSVPDTRGVPVKSASGSGLSVMSRDSRRHGLISTRRQQSTTALRRTLTAESNSGTGGKSRSRRHLLEHHSHAKESMDDKIGSGKSRSRRNLLQHQENADESNADRLHAGKSRSRRNVLQKHDNQVVAEETESATVDKTADLLDRATKTMAKTRLASATEPAPRSGFRRAGSHDRILKTAFERAHKQHGSHGDLDLVYGTLGKELGSGRNARWGVAESSSRPVSSNTETSPFTSMMQPVSTDNFVSSDEFAAADFSTGAVAALRALRTSALGGMKPISGPQILAPSLLGGGDAADDESEASSVFL